MLWSLSSVGRSYSLRQIARQLYFFCGTLRTRNGSQSYLSQELHRVAHLPRLFLLGLRRRQMQRFFFFFFFLFFLGGGGRDGDWLIFSRHLGEAYVFVCTFIASVALLSYLRPAHIAYERPRDHDELFWSGLGLDDSHPYAHTEAKYTGIIPVLFSQAFCSFSARILRDPLPGEESRKQSAACKLPTCVMNSKRVKSDSQMSCYVDARKSSTIPQTSGRSTIDSWGMTVENEASYLQRAYVF